MRRAIDLVVIKNERILLIKKKQVWILPGGKIEKGERNLDCLKREVKEETGATAIVENFYNNFIGETPHKKDSLQVEVYFGRIGYWGELTPREGDSISKVKFVKHPYEYPLSNITKKIIDSLKKDGYLE